MGFIENSRGRVVSEERSGGKGGGGGGTGAGTVFAERGGTEKISCHVASSLGCQYNTGLGSVKVGLLR